MPLKYNLLFSILITGFFWVQVSTAQVSLEKSYPHSLSAIKIDATDYKYFLMDVAKSQCRVYNLDHTLWKTINITLPANYYLYDIKFVTRNLFNKDDALELWYSAYEYTTVETGLLADIPGGLYAYVVRAGEELYKFTVYAYDYSVSPGTIQTLIYTLPSSSTAAAHVTALLPDPWPNPSSGEIYLPLLPGENGALLQVISMSGQLMLEKRTSGEPYFRLSTAGWQPGTYTYRLLSGQIPSVSKLFVVK